MKMVTVTLTATEWKKIQRDVAQLKKRVEKLEKKKTTRQSAAQKKNGANGHRKNSTRLYHAAKPKARTMRESKLDDPLAKFIGAVDLGHATGLDNESIDRDLANAYAEKHEPK